MTNVKIYKCLPQIFALALTILEIHKIFIFDLQNVGQGHGVQFVQLHHSMTNVTIYKVSHKFLRQLLLFQRYKKI